MVSRKILNQMLSVIVVAAMLLGTNSQALAQGPTKSSGQSMGNSSMGSMTPYTKMTNAERQAAAQRLAKARAAERAQNGPSISPNPPTPGGTPDYFGMTPNWANSPFPASVSIFGDGADAVATVAVDATGAVLTPTIVNGGSGYTQAATTCTFIGGGGSGLTCTPVVTNGAITGITVGGAVVTPYNSVPGIRKFVDTLPLVGAANNLGNAITVAVADTTTYPGSDYLEIALVEYTQKMHSDLPPTRLRGYVQVETPVNAASSKHIALTYLNPNGTAGAPILNAAGAPVFGVDKPSYLGPTIVASSNRPTRVKFTNYLPTGPVDALTGRRPGDLWIPTDTTAMGAGEGPQGSVISALVTVGGAGYESAPTLTFAAPPCTPNPIPPATVDPNCNTAAGTANIANGAVTSVTITQGGVGYTSAPLVTVTGGSGFTVAAAVTAVITGYPGDSYSGNRATLHLHGGMTPWISDGTPHQWTTPAGETKSFDATATSYPKGVSVYNVPDMADPGAGSLTFFYTNQQSARLMFYHDHAYGLTRLNVYAGEAAGYLLVDPVEQDYVNGTNNSGKNPTLAKVLPADILPLVIQDKTFVPSAPQLAAQDPTWDPAKWGGYGNLWLPHVYMPNQNPSDPGGANAMGRWDYGPWFWPIFNTVAHGEVRNPLCTWTPNITDPAATSVCPAGENPMNPGTPNPSLTPEGFMDTAMVNGTPYPALSVQPRAYRFRILNAANDRAFNLSLFTAASNGTMWNPDGTLNDPNAGEVPMVAAVPGNPTFPPTWPTDGRAGGVPDPLAAGPSWIQIGTEGGFLKQSTVIPPNPSNYNYNRRDIVVLNVQDHSLWLGPAERADVIVDFSQFAGKTLILYNDSPAPVPAFDTRTDYYTGNPDQTSTGGAPSTLPGYGPNTRTIMQIKVGSCVPVAPATSCGGVALNSISVTNGGAGYTSTPTVAISNGGGTGVQAGTTGSISSLGVTNAGSGYTAAPVVTIAAPTCTAGPTCVTATANAIVHNGYLTGFMITNPGAGYTSAPLVTIAGTATANAYLSVTAVNVTNLGSGFTSSPDVDLLAGSGWGATAVANLAPGIPYAPTTAQLDAFLAAAVGATQDPFVVPDGTFARIQDTALTFNTPSQATPLTLNMGNKAIQELFETDYGRMNATLGTEIPFTNSNNQTTIPFGYIDPTTENINDNITPASPIAGDGTQIWKITHNGVDTHFIHFHLFNVQLINRTGWDGAVRMPDANELGWKETVRMNPLEDAFVALRPIAPKLNFGIPNSLRPMDVTRNIGSTMGFWPQDPNGNPVTTVNQVVDFGWEYVWHCHILGHEENDMMRPIKFNFVTAVPAASVLSATLTPPPAAYAVNLTWTDPTPATPANLGKPTNEIGYKILRSADNGVTFVQIGTALANQTTFSDTAVVATITYQYRVVAYNQAGSTVSNTITVTSPVPTAPVNLSAVLQLGANGLPRVNLVFGDRSTNETGFVVDRSTNGGTTWTLGYANVGLKAGSGTNVNYLDTGVTMGTTYTYRVKAVNGVWSSAYTNQATAIVALPGAPTNVQVTATRTGTTDLLTLTWTPGAPLNQDNFSIDRATNAGFTAGLVTTRVSGTTTSFSVAYVRGVNVFFRIRSMNALGLSGFVNANPSPILTP